VLVKKQFACNLKATISKTHPKGQHHHDAPNGKRLESAAEGYNQPVNCQRLRKNKLIFSGGGARDSIGREGIPSLVMDLTPSCSCIFEHFELFGVMAHRISRYALSNPIPMYNGQAGEKYSVLNHFVSELDEVHVSRGAKIFNGGLITAGALFYPCTLGLRFSVPNPWTKFEMIAGIWTAVWLLLIGVLPMNI
jgi:hypothetical protein